MHFHLNQFYERPSECASFLSTDQVVKAYQGQNNLYNNGCNVLLYGNDFSLNKLYAYRLIECLGKGSLRTRMETITIQSVDITYGVNDTFVEINFDAHLNKEKMTMIEFIKELGSTKNIVNPKHIIMLLHMDKLTQLMQCRLRRIIERSQTTTVYVAVCTRFAQVISPIVSRFSAIRIPDMTDPQKKKIVKQLCEPDMDTKQLQKVVNAHAKTFEAVVMSCFIHSLNGEKFSKQIKQYQFVEKDLSVLFKSFSSCKSVSLAIGTIRNAVYKLIHYNLPHQEVARLVVTLAPAILSDQKMHALVRILTTFDCTVLNINQCKLIHAYEKMLYDLYLLTL